jgi:putative sigma-54 modulation protein
LQGWQWPHRQAKLATREKVQVTGRWSVPVLRGPSAIEWNKEPCVVQVAITCKHGQLAPNQQQYMTRKSEKLLTYFERVTAINVTVSFEKGRVRVEILVDAEHKHNFVAAEVGDDAVPTFDVTLHKMEQQIKKYKEKIQDHRRDLPLNELGPGA